MSAIGVPIKVLHEAEGHTVTVETMLGEVYRGKLLEAEDNMNIQMESCTVTYRNGQTARLENVFIRGSKIRFIILPDMLKNAPMFKTMTFKTGKSAILGSQAARGARGGRGGRGFRFMPRGDRGGGSRGGPSRYSSDSRGGGGGRDRY